MFYVICYATVGLCHVSCFVISFDATRVMFYFTLCCATFFYTFLLNIILLCYFYVTLSCYFEQASDLSYCPQFQQIAMTPNG